MIDPSGILTGTCLMPVLPGLCDDDANLEAVVRQTAAAGGTFVLAGSLTLADQQREYFFNVLGERFPDLLAQYRPLYPPGSYAPAGYPWPRIALRVRELCQKYGLHDRMPRPVAPTDRRLRSKKMAEQLANRAYDLEIRQQPQKQVWAYRKAAWAVEDLEPDIGLVYRALGLKGLQAIPGVEGGVAVEMERMVLEG